MRGALKASLVWCLYIHFLGDSDRLLWVEYFTGRKIGEGIGVHTN